MFQLKFTTENTTYNITKYEDCGDAPYLLYLHGGPGFCSGPELELFAPLVSRHFNCLWFDQLGSHSSPVLTPDRLSWNNLLADIQEVIRNHAPSPIHLVAHSFGAHIAHAVIETCPDRIADVLFLSPSHDLPSRMKRALRLAYDRPKVALDETRRLELTRFLNVPSEHFGLQESEKFVSLVLEAPEFWSLHWENQEAMMQYFPIAASHPPDIDAFLRFNTAAYQQKFDPLIYSSRKVLILQGAEDRNTTLEDDASPLARYIGNAEIKLINGAGHWPHLEQTEKVIAEMTRFFQ